MKWISIRHGKSGHIHINLEQISVVFVPDGYDQAEVSVVDGQTYWVKVSPEFYAALGIHELEG